MSAPPSRHPFGTPPTGSTVTNTLDNGQHGTVLQVGHVHGDLALHAACDDTAGPVSIRPPLDRVTSDLHGRDDLVATLLDGVLRQDGATTVLHGAGGGGKTAAALTLADLLDHEHRRIRLWWIDASTERSLTAGLRELALDAGAPIDTVIRAWSGQLSPVPVLTDALARHPRPWVVIVDNADDTRLLQPWLPALRHRTGHVLITSRDGTGDRWPRHATLVPLRPLTREHAADVLCSLAPRAGTRDQALLLADTLGRLPLALHLAGRYLRGAAALPPVPGVLLPVDFDHYRRTFHDHFAHVDRLHNLGRDLDERALLTRTWELSLDLLHDRGLRHARPLLRWLSCFAPAPLPYVLANPDILIHSPLFPGITGADITDTLTVLVDFGLIDQVDFRDSRSSATTTRSMLIHPVIREANRHQPDLLADPRPYLALCVAVLDGATSHLHTADPTHRSCWAALIPHLDHLVDHVAHHPDLPDTWRLLATKLTRSTAVFAHLAGTPARAETLYHDALTVRHQHLGPHHPDVLTLRRDLAWLHWTGHPTPDPDHLQRCRAEYTGLIDHCTTHLGEHHPLTLTCRFDLAWIDIQDRRHSSDPAEAVERYRNLIRAEHQAYGRHEISGLAVQLELIAHLWRRTVACTPQPHVTMPPHYITLVTTEFERLFAMIDDIEQHPDLHAGLPMTVDQLRDSALHLHHAFATRHNRHPNAGPPRAT
ncbi:tetratricopeptide repeat protein [Saccharothrix syringae]|uniref:Tetratricopeptide repeat protein n=1 Tax=Saccharothrix syringae TaxID=103733 RepID=A0A5Q0H2F3_SACSY|nr:tetratricopeptide repeat protein [Saccharothrix syringae]QFZ20416.1 tetratricopeptide repeat protein [Saccharothrix syringae]